MATTPTSAGIHTTERSRYSQTKAVLESLRPGQWVKNGFIFAALIFSRNLTDWHRDARVVLAALLFCLISGALYLLNDVMDAPEDRKHPVKRLRPVASGRLDAHRAASVAVLLVAISLVGGWVLDRHFFLVLCAYAGINLLYSWLLRRFVLFDVFIVAAGFVLRVVAGGVVIHVQLSSWLIVCTIMVALFLALCKRRHELIILGDDAFKHRAILASYSPYFLDQLIGVVTASTVMSYALYTLSPDIRAKFPGKRLEFTIPFVLFGIFRYLYLVHQEEEGGDPARVLLSDPVLLSVVLMWAASVVFIIYL